MSLEKPQESMIAEPETKSMEDMDNESSMNESSDNSSDNSSEDKM